MDPLLIILILAAGAMFLLSSRTRKQQRQVTEFRQSLDVGDEVMTGSGLFGTIVAIDGDVITLESPSGAQTDWLRAAISKLATPPYAAEEEYEEEDADELEDDEEYVDEDEYVDDVETEQDEHTARPGEGVGGDEPRARS